MTFQKSPRDPQSGPGGKRGRREGSRLRGWDQREEGDGREVSREESFSMVELQVFLAVSVRGKGSSAKGSVKERKRACKALVISHLSFIGGGGKGARRGTHGEA